MIDERSLKKEINALKPVTIEDIPNRYIPNDKPIRKPSKEHYTEKPEPQNPNQVRKQREQTFIENFAYFLAKSNVVGRSYYEARHIDKPEAPLWKSMDKATRDRHSNAGSKFLRNNPEVRRQAQEIIIQEKEFLLNDFEVEKEWILNKLKMIVDLTMTPNFKSDGTMKIDSAGANKALELMGKTMGMYVDKTETLTKTEFNVNVVDD